MQGGRVWCRGLKVFVDCSDGRRRSGMRSSQLCFDRSIEVRGCIGEMIGGRASMRKARGSSQVSQ